MKNSFARHGALVVALISLSVHARAADVDINFTEYTLDNGLRLVVHEDNKAPIVAINVWYHVGSKNEKRGKTGFAHLFEHLMFNGTENLSRRRISATAPASRSSWSATRTSSRRSAGRRAIA